MRHERAKLGDLLHIDPKKFARITGDRTNSRSRRIGSETIHLPIDEHLRGSFTQVLADETPPSA